MVNMINIIPAYSQNINMVMGMLAFSSKYHCALQRY